MTPSTQLLGRSYQRIPPHGGRTIVVGDIHGCWAELQQLLDQLQFTEADVLLGVGDLVDRGPGSFAVARFFRDTPNAYTALGNHERRVAGVIRTQVPPAWTQRQTLQQCPAAEHADWAEYFANLPAVIETDAVLVVHGRLDPQQPIDGQDPKFACAVGGPKIEIPLDAEGVPLWFHAWQARNAGANKPICIGHLRYARVELVPGRLYALDTDAVQGGSLTALVLPEGRLVAIPVRENYLEQAQARWSQWRWQYELAPEVLTFGLYATLTKSKDRSDDERRAVAAFEHRLETTDFSGRLDALRTALEAHHGPIPDKGGERGAALQALAAAYPDAPGGLLKNVFVSPNQRLARIGRDLQAYKLDEAIQLLDTLITSVRTAGCGGETL